LFSAVYLNKILTKLFNRPPTLHFHHHVMGSGMVKWFTFPPAPLSTNTKKHLQAQNWLTRAKSSSFMQTVCLL